jgi:hypothetical protein
MRGPDTSDQELSFKLTPAIWITSILLLHLTTPFASAITLIVLAMWCLGGRSSRVVQAVSLGILVTFLNPGLVGQQLFHAPFKWLLVLTGAGRLFLEMVGRRKGAPGWLVALAGFCLIAGVLAMKTSPDWQLSLFKLTAFAAGVVATLGWYPNTHGEYEKIRDWFYTLYGIVVIIGCLLQLSRYGYYLSPTSFQGILNHPQAYGIYTVPMTAFLSSQLLGSRTVNKVKLVLVVLSWFQIYSSGCRTAFVAAGLGLLLGFSAEALRRGSARWSVGLSALRVGLGVSLVSALVALGLLSGLELVQTAVRFVFKSESVESFDIGVLAGRSREKQIRNSLNLIAAYPITGIGFGLTSEEPMTNVERDPFTGLPVSAPTEPGFIHLGILAQVGIVGSAMFALLLFSVFRPILRNGSSPIRVLALTTFCLNFGEMGILSTGGLGLFMWQMFGFCRTASDCSKDLSRPIGINYVRSSSRGCCYRPVLRKFGGVK